VIDHLERIWQALIDLTATLVIPDWGALIALLPVFLVLFVFGPIVTILMLVWLIYFLRRPRPKVAFDEGPRAATLGPDGKPYFPPGEPYCPIDGLIYPFGETRCQNGHELAVICPKCGLGRSAEIATCGNCGLVLKVVPRARALVPAGPPPGGATIA
jgi:hypothetical protein